MAKVLLVEDDNNLREIFEMRVQAEGFDTVVAGDGEEGLVVAMKEKPDLIVADVMMPKLSGFEMLETLRAAPEMANTKVIMMTALGQAEDQARGEKLGVVKYLVKSQVTLEDFARVIKEVLGSSEGSEVGKDKDDEVKEESSQNNNESEKPMPEDNNSPTNPAQADPAAPAPNPISTPPADSGTPAVDGQQSSAQEQSSVNDQINSFVSSDPAPAAPTGDDSAAPTEHVDVPVAEPPAGDSPAPAPADPAAPESDSSSPPPPAGL